MEEISIQPSAWGSTKVVYWAGYVLPLHSFAG